VITEADAWNGGHYELAMHYQPGTLLDDVLRAVWSFPAIVGPVASRQAELQQQPIVQPRADAGELVGIAQLPGGGECVCATYAFPALDDVTFDEVNFDIPLGSLGAAWPEVGSFPFAVDPADVEVWEQRLESLLVALAQHVFAQAPFLRGTTSFDGMGVDDGARRPGPVPHERTCGILDVRDGTVAWYPPTFRGGFEINA
jgi:hypothetical protein